MKINIAEIEADESKSNPMTVAMRYKHCPIGEICMYLAVGGAIIASCKHLAPDDDAAICTHEAVNE